MANEVKTPYELFGVECAEGWRDLYMPLIQRCNDLGAQVVQVKEKFGELRFYYCLPPGVSKEAGEELLNAVCAAEVASRSTCELCGQPGKTRNNRSWLRTLCDLHAVKKEPVT